MDSTASADTQIEEINENAFDAAGVDLTQIDLMLALTPQERLVVMYETAVSLSRLMSDADTD
ncbi:MAG: hypothetical protein KF718_26595 [Polyangiaceae bacterium]|nr:hypothetical protein [Polyangiaceae bacterium]